MNILTTLKKLRITFTCFFFFSAPIGLFAQPKILWQSVLGGSRNDYGSCIQHTHEGGYIAAGTTESNDDDVSGNHGNSDIWVTKMDSTGNVEWSKCYGGSGYEGFSGYESIEQTKDGGYIIGGYTSSKDGEVTGYHTSTWGFDDMWIVKISSNGTLEWEKTYGGSMDEGAFSVHQTFDGGYIVGGYTTSNDGDVSGIHGTATSSGFYSLDVWVLKLDDTGAIQWQKCFGGSKNDLCKSIQQTSDSGYIFTGYCLSTDGDVVGHHNPTVDNWDIWVVKLTPGGAISWQKCIGGNGHESASSIRQTFDKGYVVCAEGNSTNEDFRTMTRPRDFDIFKMDRLGNVAWAKNYGGSNGEFPNCIQQTSDSGYVLVGTSLSLDGDVTGHHGDTSTIDIWAIKTDKVGKLMWERSLGGSGIDNGMYITQSDKGSYELCGFTQSYDGDIVPGSIYGGSDIWIVKLSTDSATGVLVVFEPWESIKVYPTNTRGTVHIQLPAGFENSSLSLFDIGGRSVDFESSGSALDRTIYLSNAAAGVYVLHINNKGDSYNYKLVYRP